MPPPAGAAVPAVAGGGSGAPLVPLPSTAAAAVFAVTVLPDLAHAAPVVAGGKKTLLAGCSGRI